MNLRRVFFQYIVNQAISFVGVGIFLITSHRLFSISFLRGLGNLYIAYALLLLVSTLSYSIARRLLMPLDNILGSTIVQINYLVIIFGIIDEYNTTKGVTNGSNDPTVTMYSLFGIFLVVIIFFFVLIVVNTIPVVARMIHLANNPDERWRTRHRLRIEAREISVGLPRFCFICVLLFFIAGVIAIITQSDDPLIYFGMSISLLGYFFAFGSNLHPIRFPRRRR
jgi:hypothetical protein